MDQSQQLTKSLQKTIKRFITVVRAAQVVKENNSTPYDIENSDSDLDVLKSPILMEFQDATLLPVIESKSTTSDAGMSSSMMATTTLLSTTIRSQNSLDFEHKELVAQDGRSDVIPEADVEAANLRNFAYGFFSAELDSLDYKLQLPKPMNLFKLTFAQKLHMEAIKAGLRLVSTAEDSSQLFYRVFNRILDFSTRESYRALLSRVLYENFDQSLQPPPETGLDKLSSGGESCVWLHASDVATYFRSVGMDIDSSPDIVSIDIHPKFWSNRGSNIQNLPAPGFITLLDDNDFAKQSSQEALHGVPFISINSSQNFTGAARGSNEHKFHTLNPVYNTQHYGNSPMSVDVSKLIHGKYSISSTYTATSYV
jgi:hypothetical protein